MNHLHESVRPYLLKSDSERINKILSDRWIGYSRAKKILEKLEDCLTQPPILRMPCKLLFGETNNGKTILVTRYYNSNKPYINPEDNGIVAPVFYVQAPPRPDEKRFYNAILDKLYTPYKYFDRVDKKQQQVISLLSRINNKVLIIDEIHHVLAGTMTAQRTFLNVLKFLSNELQIILVAVGIQDAFNVINADPQLANRFEPIVLPKWQYDDEYLKLLASFEYMLPLKKTSNIIDEKIALKILSMSEGTIGEISDILKKASIMAIQNGSELISFKLLETIDYIPPSERRRQIDKGR
jgi:type II secretory pathway predicted ATPase ExeA